MGKKITVDSATLMNKGLKLLKRIIFWASYDQIEIIIHPQSIIHSMVELDDSSVLAQLGWPEWSSYFVCLSWPGRLKTPWPRLKLTEIGILTFREPDTKKYPCMELAYNAGKSGGTMPAVLNAANEKAVELFLEERFKFIDIPKVIEAVCEKHKNDLNLQPSLSEILEIDNWERQEVLNFSNKNTKKIAI